MTIRTARVDEWPFLQDLNNEVFIDNQKYDPDLVLDWAHSEQGKKYFQEVVSNSERLCLVAEADAKLVGYLVASPKSFSYRKSTYCEIDNMGVVPEYRSQGVGRELVTACITWAKTHGYQKIYVNAYWGNEQARAFYKRVGFSEIDVSLEMEV